mmetsp:Transcript_97746/g.280830  ORF Transcript_97746/g.280830 Transcript_97746/m.280830 type:complete len:317 (+) Transcript_97746:51-1001(+)
MESQAQQQAGHYAAVGAGPGGAAPGGAAPIRLPFPQTAAGADASPASAHGSADGSAVGEPAPEMSPSGQSPMDRYFEPNDLRWFDPALHTIVSRKTGGMPDGQGLCLMTSPGLPAPRPTAPPASLSPAAALPVDGAASADAPPQPPPQPPASERASQALFFEEASNYYGGMYGLMPPMSVAWPWPHGVPGASSAPAFTSSGGGMGTSAGNLQSESLGLTIDLSGTNSAMAAPTKLGPRSAAAGTWSRTAAVAPPPMNTSMAIMDADIPLSRRSFAGSTASTAVRAPSAIYVDLSALKEKHAAVAYFNGTSVSRAGG